jgi:hypothetical protein
MHPKPNAETSNPLFPNCRVCMNPPPKNRPQRARRITKEEQSLRSDVPLRGQYSLLLRVAMRHKGIYESYDLILNARSGIIKPTINPLLCIDFCLTHVFANEEVLSDISGIPYPKGNLGGRASGMDMDYSYR